MPIDISPRCVHLLRSWFFRTREATFKSCYPPITTTWVKKGLAWQQIGVGFDQSRCTSPRELTDRDEAGHQFGKLDPECQGVMVAYWCHEWPIPKIGKALGISTRGARSVVWECSSDYERLCVNAGLIDVEVSRNG